MDEDENGTFTDTNDTAYSNTQPQFGVFFDGAGSSTDVSGKITSATLSHFFIGLDDSPKVDDNHDDIVVRVSVVPLPAAAWLLLGVSGGLIAAKRRSSARKAA